MFDMPLLFAKSVDGLQFYENEIIYNTDYPEFHPNRFTFKFLRTRNVQIENNTFSDPEKVSLDIE